LIVAAASTGLRNVWAECLFVDPAEDIALCDFIAKPAFNVTATTWHQDGAYWWIKPALARAHGNFRLPIDIPYIAHEGAWALGVWLSGNNFRERSPCCGAYQRYPLNRVAALRPDRRHVIQLFSGKVALRVCTGDASDIRLATAPRAAQCHTP